MSATGDRLTMPTTFGQWVERGEAAMRTAFGTASFRQGRVACALLVLASLMAWPTAAAGTPDGLSVSVTRGEVHFRAAGDDTAGFQGSFAITGDDDPVCGDDVVISLGSGLTWKADGSGFRQDKARCIWRRATGRFRAIVLNFSSGSWTASLRVELQGITNPVATGLTIGHAGGGQTIQMTESRNVWTYP
jgi:hypothetical protein